jgi:hypothetical protein
MPGFGDRCFISHFARGLCGDWITGDRAGPLGGCSTRLCRLRTDGLAPASKYWTYWSHAGDMVPLSLVAGHQQKIGFAPTTSMAVSGEKLGTDPRISQLTYCGLCWETFFSGAVALPNSIDDYVKGCYALTVCNVCGMLVGFLLQGVHRFESLRLSDMSNRLFAAVST